ncbi:MAG: DHHA1 domain-containing protein [Candidatus Methanomethylicaceae archaeon]|nr:DHHA1 domain-containing protein [Candidatus Verstraetearchaeota archaeon]
MEWILTHGDCDGICSAAIALSIFRNAKIFFTHPVGLHEDLKHVDGDVLILDIAISSKKIDEILKEFKRIYENGHKIIYIDHHPIPNNFIMNYGELIHSLTSCTSELTYIKFENFLDQDISRVAIYGAIGDYLDETYNIKRLLRLWDKRHLYLESGILIAAIESIGRNYDLKREIVKYLSEKNLPSKNSELVNRALEEAKKEEEMRKIIKERLKIIEKVAYVIDLNWSLGKTAIYARAMANAIVGIGAESRKDFIDMSLRTPFEYIELNKIAMEVAEKLGGSGGGHPKAAGARVPKEKFFEFIDEVNKYIVKEEISETLEY